jgi:DNA-binding response OmpR family regulator
MHLLVADDAAACRAHIARLLTAWRLDVTTAADGEGAWQVLQRDRTIGAAILNWLMPGLDGTEVCRRLARAGRRDVYTILAVGRRFADDLRRAGPRADGYLPKPFSQRDLAMQVRNALRARRLSRPDGPLVVLSPAGRHRAGSGGPALSAVLSRSAARGGGCVGIGGSPAGRPAATPGDSSVWHLRPFD